MKSTVKHLLLLLFLLVAGYFAFLGLEFYHYRKADSLYERLVHENPTTKDGVDAILASCRQVPIPMSESMWGSDRVLATNETCIQYRVCGLASCPIDVVYIGKVTTALLMSGFSLLLLGFPTIEGLGLIDASWLPVLNSTGGCIGILFVYAGCVCSVITAAIYTHEFNRIKREAIAGGWEKPKR